MACEYYQICRKFAVTMCTDDVEKCHADDYVFHCEERDMIVKGLLAKLEPKGLYNTQRREP